MNKDKTIIDRDQPMALKPKKEDLMKFKRSHLIEGNILPIYENWKNNEKLLGYARLNFKVSTKKEEYPFERAKVGKGNMAIYKFQKWNLTYVDPFEFNPKMDLKKRWEYVSRKGFTHEWNISYFETIDSMYRS